MYVHFHLVIFFPIVPQNIFDVSQAVVVHKTQVDKQWTSWPEGISFLRFCAAGQPQRAWDWLCCHLQYPRRAMGPSTIFGRLRLRSAPQSIIAAQSGSSGGM